MVYQLWLINKVPHIRYNKELTQQQKFYFILCKQNQRDVVSVVDAGGTTPEQIGQGCLDPGIQRYTVDTI